LYAVVSDIAVFVLKRDIKLKPTNQLYADPLVNNTVG